jgi:hypothetical protein
MLFHVTMTHTEDNCPGYHLEGLSERYAAYEKLEGLAKELNVVEHFHVWCPPDHIGFLLVEADSLAAVSRYLFAIPIRQDYKVVPVESFQDTMAMGKTMMEQARGER